jgi:hypothetical protein
MFSVAARLNAELLVRGSTLMTEAVCFMLGPATRARSCAITLKSPIRKRAMKALTRLTAIDGNIMRFLIKSG